MATLLAKKRGPVCRFGVEALVDESLEGNPFCEHGPTLLFERFYGKGMSRKFFACSACRDRKQCPFFQWADEKITEGKKLIQKEAKSKIGNEKKNGPISENDIWCHSCDKGCTEEESNQHHTDHSTSVLTKEDIEQPSKLLSPKENSKANAQYFFEEKSCSYLVKLIEKLGYKKIVCIGIPRIFEVLQRNEELDTLLLDIDKRFEQFYPTEKFLRYNMFNNFFFNTIDGENALKGFMNSTKEEVLLLIDPPFGGLINVLAKTIRRMWELVSGGTLDTILVFPYFLENHVNDAIPLLKMSDYKICYTNHPTYNNNNKKRGSPVRMFTNISLDKIALPKDEYRFCKICKKWVAKQNKHCTKCNDCTSKDGRQTYIHCEECKKCVKPGRNHCSNCNRCEPKDHECVTERVLIGCHICGKFDHKRRDCPKRANTAGSVTTVGKKRKKQNKENDQKQAKTPKGKSKKSPKKKLRI